jgi:predicted lipoprotein with Yx(FWY)xxD motif
MCGPNGEQQEEPMQRSRWGRRVAIAASALAIGAVAACGSGQPEARPVAAQEPGGDYGAPPNASAPENNNTAVASKLGITTAGQLGKVVVDGKGMALYRFDSDTAKPPKSNCAADCAAAWPPASVPADGNVEVEGVDKSLVGTVDRADGTKQLTIANWPAYYYAEDTAPGDVKGQGVGNKWFAFTPAGKKAANQVAAPAVKLAVMKVAPLGEIVVDAEGMTLYRFDKDTPNPPKSNCDGDCANKWPPLIVPEGAEIQVDGIDKAAVGTVVRTDGTKQATINGWSLYRFAQDKVPCDTNGQGVGGTWFASTPAGKKAGV